MTVESKDTIVGEFTAGWGFALAIPAVLLFFVFVYAGEEGRGEVAAVASVSILASIKIFWPLRRKLWFWITLLCIAAAHLAVFVSVPAGDAGLDGRFAPLMFIDVGLVCVVIFLISKLMRKIAA